MTEEEWNACQIPMPLIELLRSRMSERKQRLFACACCRRIRTLLTDHASRALTVAERYADSRVPAHALHVARAAVGLPKAEARKAAARAVREAAYNDWHPGFASRAARFAAEAFARIDDSRRGLDPSMNTEFATQTNFVRDIFGNPFRPVAFDPSWRTETVVALATGIYEDRAFERMPILADALQDAGCEHPDILTHCRVPGEHVRGCWVVDLVLGKE